MRRKLVAEMLASCIHAYTNRAVDVYNQPIIRMWAVCHRCPESNTAEGKTGILDHPVQDLAAATAAMPPADPVYNVYRSSDGVDFCIAADGVSDHGDTAILGRALGGALGVKVQGTGLTAGDVEAAVAERTYTEITAALDKAGIPVRTPVSFSAPFGAGVTHGIMTKPMIVHGTICRHCQLTRLTSCTACIILLSRTAPKKRHERAVQQSVTGELLH